ncbi:MAG: hypothetical protein HYT87_06735 [Nitrospirae bacterium]|nr:hypothetical protein [Nitrospirota bacterium]
MNKGVKRKPSAGSRRVKDRALGREVGFSWDRAAADLLPEPIHVAIDILSRGVRLADNLIDLGHDVETRLRRNLDRFAERLEELRM